MRKVVEQRRTRVTMEQIANAAGVSTSTVSIVLNERPNIMAISPPTRQRVLEAAEKLGYRPNAAARSLATGRSHAMLVAVLEPVYWDLSFAQLFRGVMDCLMPLGYAIHACAVDLNPYNDAYASILRSGRADGVLLTGTLNSRTRPAFDELHKVADSVGIPIVGLANAFPPEYVRILTNVDDESGGEQATRHLIEHGHRRIALIEPANIAWAEGRSRGYRKALDEAGIPINPDLIITLEDHDQRAAYNAALEIAKTQVFTALFVESDYMAVAAMSALKTAGKRIPEDCAIIGYNDNSYWVEYSDPPLTTVHNPFYEAGRAAGEALVNVVEGRPVEPVVLPVSLVIRKSCGCTAKCDSSGLSVVSPPFFEAARDLIQ